MKVLDLECSQGHTFEGWFGSEEDFVSQCERALVQCPMCADAKVTKKLSAPRLNLLTSRLEPQSTVVESSSRSQAVVPVEESAAVPEAPEAHIAWLKMVQHVVANTEDVGQGFAEEARKMHYGEIEERNIRGQVSMEETRLLLEEGIPVMPLPMPAALKGSVH